MMDKLQQLLDEFRNDKMWNTKNKDGTGRFDKELKWIEEMVKDYAEKLGFTIDKTVEMMEDKRNYSWPNYYQAANFPPLNTEDLIGIFETFEDFRDYSKKYKGFKCPICKTISSHPQNCSNTDCDWKSYGLFGVGTVPVIIIESGFKAIRIFPPVPIEEALDGQG